MKYTHIETVDEPSLEGSGNRGTAYSNNNNSNSSSTNNKSNNSNTKTKRWSYRPISVLGQGTFGIVIHAKVIETNEDVAIKRIRYDGRLHNRELIIMQKISHGDDNTNENNNNNSSSHHHHNTNNFNSRATTTTTNTSTSDASNDQHTESSVQFPESALSVSTTSFFSHLGCTFNNISRRWLLCAHPHVVQLRTFYFTNDIESGESFLHLVLSYLPTDLYQLKRHHFTSLSQQDKHQRQENQKFTSFASTSSKMKKTVPQEEEEEWEEEKTEYECEECSKETKAQSAELIDSSCTSDNKDMVLWCKVIIFQLARALAFLHARHICHRDVKPANVFIDPQTGRVQLGDYGSAKEIVHPLLEKNVSYICSRYYRAPELLFGALHYSYAVDMWSLGCITAELLRPRGATLFRGITTIDQLAEIVKVLGSPSLNDVYAFNPSCVEAMRIMHQKIYNNECTTKSSNNDKDKTASMNTNVTEKMKETDLRNEESTKLSSKICECSEESLQEEKEKDKEQNYNCEESEEEEEKLLQENVGWLNDELDKMSGSVLYDVMKIEPIAWHELLYSCTPTSGVDLVSKLLKYAPSDRLTAANVVEHAFFDDLFVHEDRKHKSELAEETSNTETVKAANRQTESDNTPRKAAFKHVPRLPNGNVLPIEMFLLTLDEQNIYSKSLQEKMWRTALAIHAASTS